VASLHPGISHAYVFGMKLGLVWTLMGIPFLMACGHTRAPADEPTAGAGAGGELVDASPGTVTFEVTADPAKSFCGTSRSCKEPEFVSILDGTGAAIRRAEANCSAVACETCAAPGCIGIECPTVGKAITEQKLTWDGAVNVQATCGASATSCVRQAFVPEGNYRVRLCLTPGTVTEGDAPECVASGAPECVELSFAFPNDGVISASF
jgi:hypothetical protein